MQDLLLYYPNQPDTSRLFVESPSALGLPFESLFLRSVSRGASSVVSSVRKPRNTQPFQRVPFRVVLQNAGRFAHPRLPVDAAAAAAQRCAHAHLFPWQCRQYRTQVTWSHSLHSVCLGVCICVFRCIAQTQHTPTHNTTEQMKHQLFERIALRTRPRRDISELEF